MDLSEHLSIGDFWVEGRGAAPVLTFWEVKVRKANIFLFVCAENMLSTKL